MSTTTNDEHFWADLLARIEDGKVIPIVGERAVTFGPGDTPFYPWLARQLADFLKITAESLPPEPTVNDVVCTYLVNGGERDTVYTRLSRILRERCPPPGDTLRNLAAISAFNLYLTTTFDPLLQHALNEVRFAGRELTQVCAFYPEKPADIPARLHELTRPTLYHVLGRISSGAEFVAWEEDVLEFICSLQQHITTDNMKQLAADLKDHGLLIVGLNFSDWLVRFFLRIAKQSRLSETRAQAQYLAEGPHETISQAMVLFFRGTSRNIHVIPCRPAEFAAELARRWKEAHPPPPAGGHDASMPGTLPEREMPTGAIFISYAREDEAAAQRLKTGLEFYGCTVWYDRERLKPADHWHNGLEDAVQSRCALFLSVISRTTEHTSESYYHLERNWAEKRYDRFARGQTRDEFYVPVVIDDTRLPTSREPRVFHHIQAARLPNGGVTPDFGQHLCQIQQRRRGAMGLS